MKYKNILPTMRFRILDGNGSNVLGGDVEANNAAFVQGLEALLQQPDDRKITRITDLNVNESVQARFRSCGTTGVYKILRVL